MLVEITPLIFILLKAPLLIIDGLPNIAFFNVDIYRTENYVLILKEYFPNLITIHFAFLVATAMLILMSSLWISISASPVDASNLHFGDPQQLQHIEFLPSIFSIC